MTNEPSAGERIAAMFFNPQVKHGSHDRLAAEIDAAIAASHKPVSLEKCVDKLQRTSLTGFLNKTDYKRIVIAVLDAAGVSYE